MRQDEPAAGGVIGLVQETAHTLCFERYDFSHRLPALRSTPIIRGVALPINPGWRRTLPWAKMRVSRGGSPR